MRAIVLPANVALCLLLVTPALSVAQERSIYNRLGREVKITLSPVSRQSPPVTSPKLDANARWNIPLPPGEYEVQLELPREQRTASARLRIDARTATANLLSHKTSTAVPYRNPATGQIETQIRENERFSFVYGSAGVDPNGLRFGIHFTYDGRGIHIAGVHPNMPSTRCRDVNGAILSLEPGDHILSINGVAIQSQDQMLAAVANSPREMQFTVVDGRTGQAIDLRTTLAW